MITVAAALHAWWLTTLAPAGVPNPKPTAPPEVGKTIDLILGWLKWGATVAGLVGMLVAGTMMMVGTRNRSNMAADGANHLPKVLGGMAVVVIAPHVVDAVM